MKSRGLLDHDDGELSATSRTHFRCLKTDLISGQIMIENNGLILAAFQNTVLKRGLKPGFRPQKRLPKITEKECFMWKRDQGDKLSKTKG
jgi:hypothetical protein